MSYTAKFPIYALSYHSPSSTLILGGGGGPSRSGVPNGLLLLTLKSTNNTNTNYALEEAGELRTGDEAVMSLSLYDDKTDCLVVAGVNDRCWLMELKTKSSSSSSSSRVSSIVNALNSGSPPSPAASVSVSQSTPLSLLRTIQSDSSLSDDGYLRTTRFTPSGRSFLAGGSDGSVREWAVPEMRLLSKIEAESEILDADAQDQMLALVTGSGHIQLSLGNKSEDPITIKPSQPGFSFKFGRFFKKDSKAFLLAVENVVGMKSKRRNPNVVIYPLDSIDAKKIKPQSRQSLSIPKNCTCLHIFQDYASFGFADGSLLVTSISKTSVIFLHKKLAHPFPVTGLAIDSAKGILLSSSADGQILVSKLAVKPISSLSFPFITTLIVLISIVVLLLALFSQNLTKLTEIEDFDSFYKLFPSDL